jgi:hypothetical protein
MPRACVGAFANAPQYKGASNAIEIGSYRQTRIDRVEMERAYFPLLAFLL